MTHRNPVAAAKHSIVQVGRFLSVCAMWLRVKHHLTSKLIQKSDMAAKSTARIN